MTQALFWVGIVVIALGMGLGYWDLRDRLSRIESDLKQSTEKIDFGRNAPGVVVRPEQIR
jgi:hypothetical protein